MGVRRVVDGDRSIGWRDGAFWLGCLLAVVFSAVVIVSEDEAADAVEFGVARETADMLERRAVSVTVAGACDCVSLC
jgi:hypothetical protein